MAHQQIPEEEEGGSASDSNYATLSHRMDGEPTDEFDTNDKSIDPSLLHRLARSSLHRGRKDIIETETDEEMGQAPLLAARDAMPSLSEDDRDEQDLQVQNLDPLRSRGKPGEEETATKEETAADEMSSTSQSAQLSAAPSYARSDRSESYFSQNFWCPIWGSFWHWLCFWDQPSKEDGVVMIPLT